MQTTAFSRDACEAALCLWEAMLESRAGPETWQRALDMEWRSIGTSAMRLRAMDMAIACDAAWLSCPEDERDSVCFDWDFVPAWLREQFSEAKDN